MRSLWGGTRFAPFVEVHHQQERIMEQRTGGGAGGGKNDGSVTSRAEDLVAGASRELAELRHRVSNVNEQITEFIRTRPGTSILIALGAGFVIGRILRS